MRSRYRQDFSLAAFPSSCRRLRRFEIAVAVVSPQAPGLAEVSDIHRTFSYLAGAWEEGMVSLGRIALVVEVVEARRSAHRRDYCG